ncbi:SH3 domain-containing protein [Flavobacterium sp. H122]|uniref:SH3 domain-containing protein n=1 Tax=Flavobacterium sp. H122 TaxID=2529860 RepID=UPI0010A9E854|nr:SH3 domain-containing protein [Flavobacterium sp. H122]
MDKIKIFLFLIHILIATSYSAQEKKSVDRVTNNYNKKDVILSYEKNDSYFIRDIDVNNDNAADKIVCSKPYEGNELLVFLNQKGKYELELKSINFSEDGGNIIDDVFLNKSDKNSFIVKTKFPDRGLFECQYIIKFDNNEWILKNTTIRTYSDNSVNRQILICDIKQNLNLKDKDFESKLKYLPESEAEKIKICKKEVSGKKEFKIFDKDGFTNLRKEKTAKSEIIQSVKNGSTVDVLNDFGDWWLVKTKEGNKGYVHKSRIISD